MRRHAKKIWVVAVVAGWLGTASPLFAALASYVYTTEVSDGKTYLSKFDGTSTTFTSQGIESGLGLQPNRNSSGSGLSLLNEFNGIYVMNPGTAAGGIADQKAFQVPANTQWNQSPIGRHGVPASGNPSLSIFRATITGGVGSTPSINSPSAPFNQGISPGVVMGDLAHDLFTGAHDDHTYITAHNSDAYIDLGAFTIPEGKAVQAAGGAIMEVLGGVWYVDPSGSMTQLTNPQTDAPFASLDNNIGGKAGILGYFNADGKAWFYDSVANTVTGESGLPISSFVRVGNYALGQEASAVWLFDGAGGASPFLSGGNRFTSGLSFGDYALAVIDGETRILRDNGSGVDNGFWSGGPLDLTRATGGYLGVVNEAISGDFNGDGKVDAADYVVWRKTGGDSGPYQYSDWRTNFGAGSTGSSSNLGGVVLSTVPEPSSTMLVLGLIIGGGILRSRR